MHPRLHPAARLIHGSEDAINQTYYHTHKYYHNGHNKDDYHAVSIEQLSDLTV
jgi:hypothetical protein